MKKMHEYHVIIRNEAASLLQNDRGINLISKCIFLLYLRRLHKDLKTVEFKKQENELEKNVS